MGTDKKQEKRQLPSRYRDEIVDGKTFIGITRLAGKLLFAGMAGCKCVTMAATNRNTIGG